MYEVSWDRDSGVFLDFYRYQPNGNVFLSDGSADELWGTDGRTADDYDVPMPEKGTGGHYVGDFDTSGNIAASDEQGYPTVVRLRAGVNPADSDKPIARGTMYWDGTKGISVFTLKTILESDAYIDTAQTPWELVVHAKGDPGTAFFKKKLYQPDGTEVTETKHIIGGHVHTP